MSNFNSFYQDLYRILWKIPKILRTSAFPQTPYPTSAFDTLSPSLRTSFMDGPLSGQYSAQFCIKLCL